MENYKPNSHKSREEQVEASRERKKIERVVNGPVKIKQKGELQKIADAFTPKDRSDITSYFIWDVLVPTAKKAIVDIVCMCLNIDDPGFKRKSTPSKVSYRDYYDKGNTRRTAGDPRHASRFDYEDIIIPTRGEAEAVLAQMDDIIDRYTFVSVLDLYDVCGLDAPPYTSDKYGWTDLRTARVVPIRDGYLLKLPRALPFD